MKQSTATLTAGQIISLANVVFNVPGANLKHNLKKSIFKEFFKNRLRKPFEEGYV